MDSDWKSYCKIIYDIIMKNDHQLIEEINEIKLNGINDRQFHQLSDIIMKKISDSLNNQGMMLKSLNQIFESNNNIMCCRYLLELIKNTDDNLLLEVNELYQTFRNLDGTQDIYELINEKVLNLENVRLQYIKNSAGRNGERISQIHKIRTISTKLLKMLLHQNQTTNVILKLLDMCWLITEYPMRIVVKGTKSQKGRHFKVTIGYLANQDFNGPNEIRLINESVKIDAFMVSKEHYHQINWSQSTEIDDRYRISHSKPKISDSKWTIKDMIWIPPEDNSTSGSLSSRLSSNSRVSDKRLSDETCVIVFCVTCSYRVIDIRSNKLTQVNRKVWLYSDLTVVIVHSSPDEDVYAHITLFWEDFFGSINKSISALELVNAITQYVEIESEHKLTQSNVTYLMDRMTSLFNIQSNDSLDFIQFKRNLVIKQSGVSFAYWLFSIIHQLIKSPGIIEMWKNNMIVGFCSKNTNLFQGLTESNVFLLRFSDKSAKIGVVVRGDQTASLDVWQPFDMKELKKGKLADLLCSYEHLLNWLLMATDDFVGESRRIMTFNDTIKRFITRSEPLSDGYTRRGVVSPNKYDPIIYDCDIDDFLESDLDREFHL